jgi:O-antigen ligase
LEKLRLSDNIRPANSQILWPILVALYIAFFMVTGGLTQPSTNLVYAQLVAAGLVSAGALWHLRNGPVNRVSLFLPLMVVFCLLAVVVQLVPLPPNIWALLPGREFVSRTDEILGVAAHWRPLTLSPEGTRGDLAAILPVAAAVLACLATRRRHFHILAAAIAICAVSGVLLGLIQRTQDSNSIVFYFGLFGAPHATGTFLNHNHFAAQLYSSIPILIGLAAAIVAHWRLPRWIAIGLTICYVMFIIAGLGVVGSRAGLVLCMVAVFLSIFIARQGASKDHRNKLGSSSAAFIALLLVLLVLSQASMVTLLKFAASDPLSDYRGTINRVTLVATQRHFPVGSGYGTFVPIYQMDEKPGDILPSYVNHAHNDWLELILEGGVAAILLLGAFVVWFLIRTFQVWRFHHDNAVVVYQRAASISIFCLLLHSLVDYPLRTPALSVFFAVCCAILAVAPESISSRKSATPRRTSAEPREARSARHNAGKPFLVQNRPNS